MTQPDLSFLPGAREDLLEGVRHYRERSPRVAREFLVEIQQATRFLARHPQASPRVRGEIRRRRLLRYPYSLLYYLEEQVIVVVAVAHHRRRPDYWHHRLE